MAPFWGDQPVGGEIDAPFLAVKRRGRVEEILPVLQVKHRQTRIAFVIARRHIDGDIARGGKVSGWEAAMEKADAAFVFSAAI